VHRHHERDERVDPEEQSEQARRDDAHEFEVHLPDQRTGISSRRERAEHADLLAELRPLLLGEGEECFRGPLRVTDKTKLVEAGLGKDPGYERGKVHHAHLTDVPCPHAWVRIIQQLVFGFETAAVVSKPDVVATKEWSVQSISRTLRSRCQYLLHKKKAKLSSSFVQ